MNVKKFLKKLKSDDFYRDQIVYTHRIKARDAKSGKLDDIWVEPNYRKKGLCKKIFSELVKFFKAKGIEMMVLNFVNGNLEAEAVWNRLGFQSVLTTATAKRNEVGL